MLCLELMGCSSDDGASSNATGGSAATYTGGAAAGAASAGGAGNRGGAASQTCTTGESNCFSFFVTSRARLFALAEAFNGSTSGWGGDFRYGTGNGLTGADKICTEIAEASLPGNGKTWRAFLSTSTVNAIDRVGTGPWYDRLNRLIASNLTELVEARPGGIADATILNNLPNEDGTPHHNEETGCSNLNQCADNHDILTGSDTDGRLCTSSTCSGMGGGIPGGACRAAGAGLPSPTGPAATGLLPPRPRVPSHDRRAHLADGRGVYRGGLTTG